jgi:hypothetical protein
VQANHSLHGTEVSLLCCHSEGILFHLPVLAKKWNVTLSRRGGYASIKTKWRGVTLGTECNYRTVPIAARSSPTDGAWRTGTKIKRPPDNAGFERRSSENRDRQSWRSRLTELATQTGEARNALSFYLTLSTFGSPETKTLFELYKRKDHPSSKGMLTYLDHTISSTHKLVTP